MDMIVVRVCEALAFPTLKHQRANPSSRAEEPQTPHRSFQQLGEPRLIRRQSEQQMKLTEKGRRLEIANGAHDA